MPRQFLLNPDGSVPLGVDVAVLHAQGIPLVLPSQPQAPAKGMCLIEGDPQVLNGVWHQVWVEVPIPSAQAESTQPHEQ